MLENYGPRIILILLLSVFLSYSVFLASNLQIGMIPDEQAHFLFSKHYATTLGIPQDTDDTASVGWYIQQHHFLYHYINGRIINLVELIAPSVSDWALLVILRIISVAFSLATVLFCYYLVREIINNVWWQLLPVFLLTHTLMFVFLSAGVNYDNLANLLSMAGLFYLARVFNKRSFVSNSLGWMISIALGTLVKYTILPLALAMFVAWLIFIFIHRQLLFPLKNIGGKEIALIIVFGTLLIGNLTIYGYNLLVYRSVTPTCREILTEEQCALNPFDLRQAEQGLLQKLTISESMELGYPDPFEYLTNTWPRVMLSRIFGIAGHIGYAPRGVIFMFYLLLIWVFLLVIKYWENSPYKIFALSGIFLFYVLVLFFVNYNSELASGFKHFAVQGRYIFPVIGVAYTLVSYFVKKVENSLFRWGTLGIILALFVFGGPINFILRYNSVFFSWFR